MPGLSVDEEGDDGDPDRPNTRPLRSKGVERRSGVVPAGACSKRSTPGIGTDILVCSSLGSEKTCRAPPSSPVPEKRRLAGTAGKRPYSRRVVVVGSKDRFSGGSSIDVEGPAGVVIDGMLSPGRGGSWPPKGPTGLGGIFALSESSKVATSAVLPSNGNLTWPSCDTGSIRLDQIGTALLFPSVVTRKARTRSPMRSR